MSSTVPGNADATIVQNALKYAKGNFDSVTTVADDTYCCDASSSLGGCNARHLLPAGTME